MYQRVSLTSQSDHSHQESKEKIEFYAMIGQQFSRQMFTYGMVTLLFPAICFAFTICHWWQLEDPKGNVGRTKTLPLLLFQVWPQFRMLRLIYLGFWKKDPKWKKERQLLHENIVSLEPFLESVPQSLWVVYLKLSTYCFG